MMGMELCLKGVCLKSILNSVLDIFVNWNNCCIINRIIFTRRSKMIIKFNLKEM